MESATITLCFSNWEYLTIPNISLICSFFCVWLLVLSIFCFYILYISIWVFFNEHSRLTGHQWKKEAIPLTPLYHFHPLRRHLDISRAITAEGSPLHIASSWTWIRILWFSSGNPWFPSESRQALSYAYPVCYPDSGTL